MGKSRFEFRRGFKSKAERMSKHYREMLKLSPHSPIKARSLAKYMGVEITIPQSIPGMTDDILAVIRSSPQWSAITLQRKNGGLLIIHNNYHSPARQESDIMHELAHVICEHPLGGFVEVCDFALRVYDEEQENEADWMGGALQLSREALEWALWNKMKVDKIAEYFNASQDMVKFRINMTGILRQFRHFNPFN